MKLSKSGALAIVDREGLRLKPYQDVAGIWTYGVGAIYDVNGDRVTANTPPLTKSQAVDLFNRQVQAYANTVQSGIQWNMPQASFDAFVSVCYNIGRGAFSKSTFLKRFNGNDRVGCSEAMAWWNKVTIKGVLRVSDGLVSRREGEIDQFLGGYKQESIPQDKNVFLTTDGDFRLFVNGSEVTQ